MSIVVERGVSPARLEELGVLSWPTWTKEPSKFRWTYDEKETCYFLEGDVVVTPRCGDPVPMGKGDIAIFPAGLQCTWDVQKAVRKHYRFG